MLRRLQYWLIKRLGGYTWQEKTAAYSKGWNAGIRHVKETRSTRVNQTWQQMGEMADYLEQHHNAGFQIGFSHGMYAERRAHSCDQAFQEGFEEGAWFVLDTMDEAASRYGRMDDRIMLYQDFREAFLDLQNG